ncbi:endonuclease [Flavobacteriales bacterium 34_180_T64]|nr:endonuclease [Flavobacteriales bacterium 34_180_T64]
MKLKFTLILIIIIVVLFSCESRNKSKVEKYSPKSEIIVENNKKINNERPQKRNNQNTKNLTITTWNIRDLGKSKDVEEILKIAKIIRNFDIVAIQEVVAKDPAGAQAVAKIVDELNRMGNKWDYRISDPTKSPSVYMSERYAFLWQTSKVKLSGRAYLDENLEEKCHREPFIGKFQLKKGGDPFFVVNFHSRKHNDNPEDEIIFFKDYPKRLNSNKIIIAGDFNLNERHEVWNNLYSLGFNAAVKNSKTTLKRKCTIGNYLSHDIDNIYYSNDISLINSGVIDFIESCKNLKAARMISDHLPVFLEFYLN